MLFVTVLSQFYVTDANSELSYETMLQDWQENNSSIREIELDLEDAKRAFQQSKKNVDSASSSWSYLVDILNSIGREITPQMKFGTVMQRKVGLEKAKLLLQQQEMLAKTKHDNEYIRVRNTYLDYWQSYALVETSEKKLQIAKLTKEKNDLLYKQGKLSALENKRSEITYLETKNKVQEANRILAEKRQILSSYIGVELSTSYETGIWEDKKTLVYNPVDKYIDIALSERLDIKIIEDKIAIDKLTIETYDNYFSYSSMSERMQESYDELQESNYYINLDLDLKKIEVEKELREAFLDLNYESFKLKTLLNKRNDANSNYLRASEQLRKGKITSNDFLQAELQYLEAKNNYLIAIYSYNTLVYRFNALSSTGLNIGLNSTANNSSQGGGR